PGRLTAAARSGYFDRVRPTPPSPRGASAMGSITRRDFLQDSAFLAAALAGTGLAGDARAAEKTAAAKKGGASERLRVAVVGVNGRGMSHVGGLANKHNCVITTVCDADSVVIGRAMKAVEKAQGQPPRYEKD